MSDPIEVTRFSWRSNAPGGTTDHTVITLTEMPNSSWRIRKEDRGPETESLYGSFDHAEWIDIQKSDTPLLLTALLAHAFDADKGLNFDELKDALKDHGVEFQEGSSAIDPVTGRDAPDD